MNRNIFDELSEQLAKLAPQARAAGEDIRQTLDTALQRALAGMDIVTREEFAQLEQALQRAQQRIDALEAHINALEQAALTAAPDADALAPAPADDRPLPPPDDAPQS